MMTLTLTHIYTGATHYIDGETINECFSIARKENYEPKYYIATVYDENGKEVDF